MKLESPFFRRWRYDILLEYGMPAATLVITLSTIDRLV